MKVLIYKSQKKKINANSFRNEFIKPCWGNIRQVGIAPQFDAHVFSSFQDLFLLSEIFT